MIIKNRFWRLVEVSEKLAAQMVKKWEWEIIAKVEKKQAPQIVPKEIKKEVEPITIEWSDVDLREQYKAKFWKYPHSSMKIDKLQEKLK